MISSTYSFEQKPNFLVPNLRTLNLNIIYKSVKTQLKMMFVEHVILIRKNKNYYHSLLGFYFGLGVIRCCHKRSSARLFIQSFLLLPNNTQQGCSAAKIRFDFELSCVSMKQLKEFLLYMFFSNVYFSVLWQGDKLNEVKTVDLQA